MPRRYARKAWNTYKKGMALQNKIMNPKNMMVALRGAKLASAVLNSEKHYFDKYIANLTLNTAGSVTPLSAVVQGDDKQNRSGRSILAKSIQMKLALYQGDDTYDRQLVRFIVFYDTEQNGVLPAVSAATDVDNGVLESLHILSPLNLQASSRYRVLYDRTHAIGDITGGVGQPSIEMQQFYKKIKFHIHYSNTTAADADLDKNNIYILQIADQSGSSAFSTANIYTRLRFYDN